jgi:hypothetical protein
MIGGSDMKQYEPQVHTTVFRATSNELIALGHVVTQYITQVRRIPNPTKEQLETAAPLRNTQIPMLSSSRPIQNGGGG